MAERYYEIDTYKEWLNKPNIIIDTNKENFPKIQCQAINVMLHKAQVLCHIERKNNKNTIDDEVVRNKLANTLFEINSNELKGLFGLDDNNTTTTYIAKRMEDLNGVKLTNYSDNGDYEGVVLFPYIKYNTKECRVVFRVNSEIINKFYNIEENSQFTRLDLSELRRYKLNKHSFNLLEIIYRYLYKFQTNNYVEFEVGDFKRLIGSKADCSNSYFKSNILIKAIDEIKSVVGISIDYALNNSLSYNKTKSIRLFLDLSIKENHDFVTNHIKSTSILTEDEIENIVDKLTSENKKLIELGKAYIEKSTGKFIKVKDKHHVYELPKLKETEVKIVKKESTLKGKRFLRKYLESKNVPSDKIDNFIKNEDYDKYVKVMIKINLKEVLLEDFKKGYRYMVNENKIGVDK